MHLQRLYDDYFIFWKHNGYWLFDSPEVIIEIAREKKIDLAGTMLFYYEIYELDFDLGEWMRFEPVPSFGTNVSVPEAKVLEGYDVVSFSAETSPECSPLSCNHLAREIETNSRCLLQSFEQARQLLEDGSSYHCRARTVQDSCGVLGCLATLRSSIRRGVP